MTSTLIRGRLLSFHREPSSIEDSAAYAYESDGALLVENGVIMASGAYAAVKAAAPEDVSELDHRPHLIVPGALDTHLHFPQMQVMASYAARSARMAEHLHLSRGMPLRRNGACGADRPPFLRRDDPPRTTTATAYCSVHKTSADASSPRA